MDKTERREALLRAIVQEYIKSARPISSKTLVDEYGFDYSPATIRNDMAALEAAGYIAQPHTSAGRVPTEKGYQYYISNFIEQKELQQSKKEFIKKAVKQEEEDDRKKAQQLAKSIADLTDEAVIISFSGGGYLYTGIAHIFRKPEFVEHAEMMVTMGELFDHIDEVMGGVRQDIDNEVRVLMGNRNPFAESLSMIVSEYDMQNGPHGIFGILGPMRMDYDTNFAIFEYMESLMEEEND